MTRMSKYAERGKGHSSSVYLGNVPHIQHRTQLPDPVFWLDPQVDFVLLSNEKMYHCIF